MTIHPDLFQRQIAQEIDMSNPPLFRFKDKDIRVVIIAGEPWWVAADVCRALGLDLRSGSGNHLRKLAGGERRIVPPNLIRGKGAAQAAILSESGLYKLVMRSDKPEAKAFQNWVTKVVLPAIRKDGGYIHGEEHVVSGAMTEDELVFKAMEVMKLPTSQTSGTPPVTFITESGLAGKRKRPRSRSPWSLF